MKKEKERNPRKVRDEIEKLFLKARATAATSHKLADDFVRKARNYAMRHRANIPAPWNRSYCRHCYCFIIPGKNARIRTREGRLVVFCMKCKHIWRMPLSQRPTK